MTSGDTEAAITPLQELLDERQRYEGWIRALEQRERTTSPTVYRRVHGDYTLRLEHVLQRLSERTGQLRATAQELAVRLAGLREREAERIDARQEGELRAAVGEYDEEHWGRLREEADREIAVIADERRDVETELARMERIIESATAATPRDGSTEGDGMATPEVSAPPPDRTVSEPAGRGAEESDAAGLAGSSDVFGMPEIVPGVAREFSTAGVAAQMPTPRSVPPQATAENRGNTPAAVGQQEAPSFSVNPGHAPAQQVFAGEPKREQEKTLKCPECGTMNYATEWYCEHCGGELATF